MASQEHCRDCSRCTESLAKKWANFLNRLAFSPLLGLENIFKPRCPVCTHPLDWHARDKEGRFKD